MKEILSTIYWTILFNLQQSKIIFQLLCNFFISQVLFTIFSLQSWELMNTAVLTGRQVSQSMKVCDENNAMLWEVIITLIIMKVFIVSEAGSVADVTLHTSCSMADHSALKVSVVTMWACDINWAIKLPSLHWAINKSHRIAMSQAPGNPEADFVLLRARSFKVKTPPWNCVTSKCISRQFKINSISRFHPGNISGYIFCSKHKISRKNLQNLSRTICRFPRAAPLSMLTAPRLGAVSRLKLISNMELSQVRQL